MFLELSAGLGSCLVSVSGGLRDLWRSLTSRCILQSSVFTWHSPQVFTSSSGSKFPLFIRTWSYWVKVHPNDLLLTRPSVMSLSPSKLPLASLVAQSVLDAWGWCTGMTQRDGMGREEGSGWGTQVYLWRIHFDIWQN